MWDNVAITKACLVYIVLLMRYVYYYKAAATVHLLTLPMKIVLVTHKFPMIEVDTDKISMTCHEQHC